MSDRLVAWPVGGKGMAVVWLASRRGARTTSHLMVVVAVVERIEPSTAGS